MSFSAFRMIFSFDAVINPIKTKYISLIFIECYVMVVQRNTILASFFHIAVRQRRQPGPADQGGGPARTDVAHQDLARPRHPLRARLPPRQGEGGFVWFCNDGLVKFPIFIFAISCYHVVQCPVCAHKKPQSS